MKWAAGGIPRPPFLTFRSKCSILCIRSPAGLFKLAGGFLRLKKTMGIITHIKETRAEFKHVNWPTRKQSLAYSVAVIVISVLVAYFLGAFDKLFQIGLSKLLGL